MALIYNFLILLIQLLYFSSVQSICLLDNHFKYSNDVDGQNCPSNRTSKFLEERVPFTHYIRRTLRKKQLKSLKKAKSDSSSSRNKSDGPRGQRKIIQAVYPEITVADNNECGQVFNSPNGTVTSPNYPNRFNVTGHCVWKLKTSDGSRLIVTLNDLQLDSTVNCTQNVLLIYDGPSDRDPQLLAACNVSQLETNLIESTGDSLTIKLLSNGSTNYKGFKLSYSTDCNNNLIEGVSGAIESPIYYDSRKVNCSWTIKVPKGNNISLAIEKFNSTDSLCSSNYLSLIGKQSTRKFCPSADSTDFDLIHMIGDQVTINFVDLHPSSLSYFRLEWTLNGCGGNLYGDEGTIVSPNYPNSYPNGLNCLWLIHSKPGHRVNIYIYEYHIEKNDSLQIYDGPDTRSRQLLNLSGRIYDQMKFLTLGNYVTLLFKADDHCAGKGFKLSYSAQKNYFYKCNHHYANSNNGLISSPHYPNRFVPQTSCRWNLVNEHAPTKVLIEDLDIPWSVNCTDHYLRFLTSTDIELYRFCGNSFPTTPIKSNLEYQIEVEYFSKGPFDGRGFKVKYYTVCGTTRQESYGPDGSYYKANNFHYPLVNDGNSSCNHLFVAEALSETELRLNFLNLIIEPNSGAYLEVRDDKSNKLARYTNSTLPLPLNLGRSFNLYTEGTVLFEIIYSRKIVSCGFELSRWEGTFTSPEYPNEYPTNQICEWKINVAPGNLISLKFDSFNITSDSFCTTDHLEIREINESGPLVGRFCGSTLPQLNSTRYYPSLWIRFKSDGQSSASGFKVSYKTIKNVELITRDNSGAIASSGFPRLFSSGKTQTWMIEVDSWSKIQFKLESIDILDDSINGTCTNSSVTIYDGVCRFNPILARYCGFQSDNQTITTSSSYAFVQFKPNSDFSRFLLNWTTIHHAASPLLVPNLKYVCNYTANLKVDQNITFFTNGFYEDTNCSWTISSPAGTQLQMEIHDIAIKAPFDESCSRSKLTFYDYGPDPWKSWKINRIICDDKVKLFTLEGNHSMILFNNYADENFFPSGFKMTVTPICGGTFYGPTGHINSTSLGLSTTCSWKIIVPKGQKIEINFISFNLGSHEDYCSNGYLSIRNGYSPNSRYIGHYCGSKIPSKIVSSTNQLFLSTYIPADEHFEFSLLYREVSSPCNFNIELDQSNPSVNVQLPRYPYPPVHYFECEWTIKGPSESVIRIDFKIPDHDKHCDFDPTYVDIHEGSTQLSPKLGRYCPEERQSSVITTGNYMYIHYITRGGVGSSSFEATVSLHVCGGNYVITEGTYIQGPYYPKPYGPNLTCIYNIYSNKMVETLSYTLNLIDLPSNDNCTSGDSLSIHEDDSSGKLLDKLCGRKTYDNDVAIVQAKFNHLFMEFRSDSMTSGKGFRIWYDSSEDEYWDEHLKVSDPGVITSPRFPYAYPVGKNLSWVFVGPPGKRITLNFTHYNLNSADNSCGNKIFIDHHPDFYLKYTNLKIMIDNEKNYFMTPSNVTLPCESKETNFVIQSPSNVLAVYFESQSGLTAGQGFRAEYNGDQPSECGGSMNLTSRTIISPNFDDPVDNSTISCLWYITLKLNSDDIFDKSSTEQITYWIKFDVMEVLGSADNDSICLDGRITLGYGIDLFDFQSKNKRNQIFCGKTSEPIIAIYPHSLQFFDLMTAHFTRTRGYRGFKATLQTSECGGKLLYPEGNITSPGWPDANYPTDIVCVWTLIGDIDIFAEIQIEFEHFELEADCSKDYLEIAKHQGGGFVHRYCANEKPPPYSLREAIVITFRSDGDTTRKGFLAKYKSTKYECGDLKKQSDNRYEKPQTPYKPNQNCVTFAFVNPKNQLNVTFVKRFDIEESVNCTKDYLEISEWRNNSWTYFGRYCGFNSPGTIIFPENGAKFVLHSDGDDRLGDGFDFLVTSNCTFTIDQRGNGTITSPDYPDSYGTDYCEWTLKGQELGDTILVNFTDVHLDKNNSCEDDYIEIVSAGTITRHCAANPPKQIESNRALKVIFYAKNSNSFSRGISFDYQIFKHHL